jgi:hypothetical protein
VTSSLKQQAKVFFKNIALLSERGLGRFEGLYKRIMSGEIVGSRPAAAAKTGNLTL